MNPATRSMFLDYIIEDFNQTYREFIVEEELPDSTATKSGFFAAAETMIRENPAPDYLLQARLLTRLKKIRASLDETNVVVAEISVAKVELMFVNVSCRMNRVRLAQMMAG